MSRHLSSSLYSHAGQAPGQRTYKIPQDYLRTCSYLLIDYTWAQWLGAPRLLTSRSREATRYLSHHRGTSRRT